MASITRLASCQCRQTHLSETFYQIYSYPHPRYALVAWPYNAEFFVNLNEVT
jgi:hypothetical protein